MNPQELFSQIKEKLVLWQKDHPQTFLSHFFTQIDSNLEQKTPWEIGVYCSKDDKVYVFDEKFNLKNTDNVFKKEDDLVEELNMDKIKVDLSKAKQWFKENSQEKFLNEQFGDGFLILQKYQDNIVWNFTLVTKTVKFANMKIDAKTGNIIDVQLVNMLDK